MPHALYGPIVFDVVGTFDSFEKQNSYKFVEHAVIEGKPKLQYTGEALTTISVKFHFHSGFCVPELEYLKLVGAAKIHQPLPLTMGNGNYQGFYVIESLGQSLKQTDKNGSIVEMTVDVKLKEWDELDLMSAIKGAF